MSALAKAMRPGSIASLLVAGGLLWGGAGGLRAQQSSGRGEYRDAPYGRLRLRENILMASLQPPAAWRRWPQRPLTEKQLIKLIRHNKKHLKALDSLLAARGIDFELTPKIAARLRQAGADDNLLARLQDYTPAARAKVSVESLRAQQTSRSRAEVEAYRTLRFETNPDKQIREASAFARRFPKSSLLAYVYAIQAVAYQEKDAAEDLVAAGEKSLALDPNNLMALLLVSSTLPQPRLLARASPAEREKRLNRAESYATRALRKLEQMGKPQLASGVYASLGMVHLERARLAGPKPDRTELRKAEQSYRTAIKMCESCKSAVDYFRLGEVYALMNKREKAIAAFSRARRLAPGSVIAQYAERNIRELQK